MQRRMAATQAGGPLRSSSWTSGSSFCPALTDATRMRKVVGDPQDPGADRFLIPQSVVHPPEQGPQSPLRMFSDRDHAGDTMVIHEAGRMKSAGTSENCWSISEAMSRSASSDTGRSPASED